MAASALSSSVVLAFWPAAAAAQPPLPFNWTGFYLGGGVGAHFSDEPIELKLPDANGYDVNFEDDAPVFPATPGDMELTSWPTHFEVEDFSPAVSAIMGYNRQFGRLVLGIEADATWLGDEEDASWSDSDAWSDFSDDYIPFVSSVSRDTEVKVSGGVDSLFTIRPRIGVAATDRLLLFGTGGLAVGHATISSSASVVEQYSDFGKSLPDSTAMWDGEESEFMVGYAVGGGAEYALWDRGTIRLEGLYFDLGTLSATVHGSGSGCDGIDSCGDLTVQPYKVEQDMNGVLGRVAFTYKF